MKWGVFALLLVFSAGLAEMGIEPVLYSDSKIMPVRDDSSACNASPEFISSVKSSIISELGFGSYSFSNLTSSYCYSYGDYESISLNFVFKESESSFVSKNVGASFYVSSSFDFSVLFSERENLVLDYTLKQQYAEYLINGTDSEFYVSLYSSCANLSSVYDSFSGEKYFNQESDYCNIILKTKASEVKSLVSDVVDYVYYFGNSVKFSFSGFSENSYDLASIASSIKCDLSRNDYYYPEDLSDCYGIYKDKGRVYFSAYNEGMSVSVYGILDGKARLTVSSYGNASPADLESFMNDVTSKFFINSFSVSIEENEYGYLEGSSLISGLSLNMDALNSLNVTFSEMNSYYSSDNVYVTVSEPYIQVYVPEASTSGIVGSATVSSEVMIRSYYWGRSLVITKDKVYSSIVLDSNDEVLAVSKLKEFVDVYVPTDEWTLNMIVTGGYYYPIYYGVRESDLKIASSAMIDLDGVSEQSAINSAVSISNGVRDVLNSEFDVDFSEFEREDTTWDLIVNFFKGIFGLA